MSIVAASRLIYAVARDGVLPMSKWIGQVDAARQPRNAVTVMFLFGAALRRAGGTHYYSLERNPEFAAVTASLVELAGLRDLVRVVQVPEELAERRRVAHRCRETIRRPALRLDSA